MYSRLILIPTIDTRSLFSLIFFIYDLLEFTFRNTSESALYAYIKRNSLRPSLSLAHAAVHDIDINMLVEFKRFGIPLAVGAR